MPKTKEELQSIFDSLKKQYEVLFGEPLPLEYAVMVFSGYLEELRGKFIRNRINGLDPEGTKSLIEMAMLPKQTVKQEVPPVPPVVTTKKKNSEQNRR